MSSPRSRNIVTASFIVALLCLVILRSNNWRLPSLAWLPSNSAPQNGPDDAIYTMLDAARAGNVKSYLDAFSGPMRDQVEQLVREQSELNFAAYLKSQNAAFQGVAVSITDRPSDAEAQVRVEYVYSTRNEVQKVYLRKESARWKIVRVAGAEDKDTPIPFGSRVAE